MIQRKSDFNLEKLFVITPYDETYFLKKDVEVIGIRDFLVEIIRKELK